MRWLRRLFRPRLRRRTTYLYMLYDSVDRLLYVGISVHPQIRIQQHRRDQPWGRQIYRVWVSRIPRSSDARAVEREAINYLNPIYNKLR